MHEVLPPGSDCKRSRHGTSPWWCGSDRSLWSTWNIHPEQEAFFLFVSPSVPVWLFSHVAISFNGKDPVGIVDRLVDIGSRSITVFFFDRFWCITKVALTWSALWDGSLFFSDRLPACRQALHQRISSSWYMWQSLLKQESSQEETLELFQCASDFRYRFRGTSAFAAFHCLRSLKTLCPQLFFFIHHTAASCLYINGDILSYFSPAGYVLWFDAYDWTVRRKHKRSGGNTSNDISAVFTTPNILFRATLYS